MKEYEQGFPHVEGSTNKEAIAEWIDHQGVSSLFNDGAKDYINKKSASMLEEVDMLRRNLMLSIAGAMVLIFNMTTAFGEYDDTDLVDGTNYHTNYRTYHHYYYHPQYRYNSYNVTYNQHRAGGYQRRAYNFPSTRPASGTPVFIYDPKLLAWAAYDSRGQLVRTGAGSGGKNYCPDVGRPCHTPVGSYRIFSKFGADYVSSVFPIETGGGAPMPYAMFFKGGFAIHGSYNVPNYNASHGCIRVIPEDARWLNNAFLTRGSLVIVRPYSF